MKTSPSSDGSSASCRRRRFTCASSTSVTAASERDLERLLDLDYYDRLAIAGFAQEAAGETIVGVSRYARIEGTRRAECAIVVADGWQGRGLGTELMRTLADCSEELAQSIASKALRWPKMRESPPGRAASDSRSAPNRIQAAWSSSGWTFEVPLDQLRDGVIPALAGPCQTLERRIEVPVQLFHRAFQRLPCGRDRAPPVRGPSAASLPRLRHLADHRDSVVRHAIGDAESRRSLEIYPKQFQAHIGKFFRRIRSSCSSRRVRGRGSSRRWARRHERRARRNTSASVIPARRPRLPRHGPRAANSSAARFDGLAAVRASRFTACCRAAASSRAHGPPSQGWQRGKDIQFADLGEQVGDPLECCPEPRAPAPRKKTT